MNIHLNIPSPVYKINSELFKTKGVSVYIKREDLIHPIISGNKWRKLKYNFKEINNKKYSTVLSFGGAYSNHLHALSWFANKQKIKSIGIVRGEFKSTLNSTLSFCENNNMDLYFLDRRTYRTNKYSNKLVDDLKKKYENIYIIPDGGCNNFGIKGCEEIMKEVNQKFDFICSSFGTGCTAAGIINSLSLNQKYLGISSLKGAFYMKEEIFKMSKENKNWELNFDYHFGGFGKTNQDLEKFIKYFYVSFKIMLDPVYTGKLFFGIFDLILNNFFEPNSNILIIHTGGLQGIQK
jgi:1-aminocyclopropane-1-carboxylate deaminase